ncbi:Rossman fold protein, TIGR00730 family [Mangrovactinospora gilvigrisea]|uniref:Cytokinin riboside 5'-monophosphate phosphoribohydrolase n=1 Tax=Mangrovactinospora gilvigrisea TaxID=1428644 RepID=A0A1J7BK99_9ACTN|nr:TIGR00730 family Rossman fold protein [Mangrovactinospora gilvigrisea]OIV39062.1 Rossman fold protein, TIGR00730 family [Mangrovactinospora gilvigrisea]
MRVAVFTGSSFGSSPAFARAAEELGRGLAEAGMGIVYGGGHVGLMGAVADAALAAGGEVSGVIPRALAERELQHEGLTRLRIVETMHERKAAMAAEADAFVALPGGAGTLEELFEAWTWQHLGYHAKPVVLYDVDGFWQPLRAMVSGMVESGFIRAEFRDTLPTAGSVAELLGLLKDWRAPGGKW